MMSSLLSSNFRASSLTSLLGSGRLRILLISDKVSDKFCGDSSS